MGEEERARAPRQVGRASAPLTVEVICAALPSLSAAHRQKVELSLRALRKDATADYHEAALVFTEIAEYLTDRGQRAPFPYATFRARPEFGAFAKAADAMLWYVGRNFKPKNGAQTMKVHRLLLVILARWLERRNIAVSFRTMTQQLGRVPELVESEFPGYAERGLLPRVTVAHSGVS